MLQKLNYRKTGIDKKSTGNRTIARDRNGCSSWTQAGILLAVVAAIFIMSMGCSGTSGPGTTVPNATGITVTDSQGNTFQLPGPAGRIVCLNSDSAEMLIALGAGGSVVGVTDTTLKNTQLAPLLPNATSVGTWDAPNLERILGLHPDAIISYSGYRLKNADQFERAKIPVIYVDCNRLTTLRKDARIMGTLTGRTADAERYILFVDTWEAYVSGKTKPPPLPRYISRVIPSIWPRVPEAASMIWSA